jgi:hypothetical protein
MRKAGFAILYIVVALLMVVPPIFAGLLSAVCMNPTGASCRTVTAQDWLTGELAAIWMPPFGLALVLIGVIIWLHRKAA